jgi:hypothetical protein
LPPEKGQAQDHEQRAQDEIGHSEKEQEAMFFAGQARTLEEIFTTEAQRTQRELFKSSLHGH